MRSAPRPCRSRPNDPRQVLLIATTASEAAARTRCRPSTSPRASELRTTDFDFMNAAEPATPRRSAVFAVRKARTRSQSADIAHRTSHIARAGRGGVPPAVRKAVGEVAFRAGGRRPPNRSYTQTLFTQVWPALQALVHAPQWAGEGAWLVSQPLTAFASRLPKRA